MVGLKTVWISLVGLFLLASCVPQTKQTACDSNEAFNSTLRTCVPITQSPGSFVNISSFTPTVPFSRYKNDVTAMNFRINIANPYAISYTTKWTHTYNATNTNVTGLVTTPTTWDVSPLTFAAQVGLHLLTADVLDATSAVVASHTFQFTIDNTPRPFIDTTSVSPNSYSVTMTPNSGVQTYQFNIKHNGATIATVSTYQTQWKLYKNGVDTTLLAPNASFDNLSSTTSTDTSTADVVFNPSITTGYGIGSYVLRGRLVYVPTTEVVDERQWTISVQHPSVSPVTSRELIAGNSLSATTNAYNGVAHNSAVGTVMNYNYHPITSVGPPVILHASQANFCVKVNDGNGTYLADGRYVKVSYFLDGAGAPIYEGLTGVADRDVCITDAGNTNLNALVFNNPSATSTIDHTLVARIYDEATGVEYTNADMSSGAGTYPVTWTVQVKPQNAPPSVEFGVTSSGITCSGTSGNSKTGCAVLSDTDTTVSIKLTGDDFYFDSYDETKFNYSIRLYRNNVVVSECSKTSPDVNGATDVTGVEYQCTLRVPSFTAVGPSLLYNDTFQIKAEVSDTMSPITATPATSATLTWDLIVTENNTAPTFVAMTSNSPLSEGQHLQFNITLNDLERDNYNYHVRYCTNDACTTNAALTSAVLVTRTTGAIASTVSTSTFIPEDFLKNLTAVTGCAAPARTVGTCNIQFYVVAVDIPSNDGTYPPYVATASQTLNTSISNPVTVVIANRNPAPTLNLALASPDPSVFSGSTMTGMPFTISASAAGVLTDTSVVSSENTLRYQWYVRNASTATGWAAIDSASSQTLTWTPSLILAANTTLDNPLNLMICVEDMPSSIVPTPVLGTSQCSDATPWIITAYNNMVSAQDMTANDSGSTSLANNSTDLGTQTAAWYEDPTTTSSISSSAGYVVSVGNDNYIHVKKSLMRNTGFLQTLVDTKLVSFYAVPSGTAASVKDLQVTGSGASLYITYLASTTLAPGSFHPQVRRIDTSTGKINPNTHSAKVGFAYTGITITNNCSTPADCTVTNLADGSSPTIAFANTAKTGNIQITVPHYGTPLQIDFAAYPNATGTICGNCDNATQAANLAYAINASVDPAMIGLSATVVGGTVTIAGSTALDYVDTSAGTIIREGNRAGRPYVSGARWHLPFILAGSGNSNRVAILSGATDVNIAQAGAVVLTEPPTAGLTSIEAATKISSYFDGSFLYIATSTLSGSVGKIFKLHPTTYALLASSTIMSGSAITELQIVANASAVTVAANIVESPANMMIGNYTTALVANTEFKLNNTASVDTTTFNIFNGVDISSYALIPYGNSARMVAASQGSGATYQLYAAKIYTDGSSWHLSCSDCQQISDHSLQISPYTTINFSPVRMNVNAAPYRLGSDGAVLQEGHTDIGFLSFGQMSAAGTQTNPGLGVINLDSEVIGATSILGASPDAGLYRPPFFKN